MSGQVRHGGQGGRTPELALFQAVAGLIFGVCVVLALFMYWVAPLLAR